MVPNIVKWILIWDAELERRKRQSLNAQPTWIKLYVFPTLEFTLLEKNIFFSSASFRHSNLRYFKNTSICWQRV